MCAVAGAFSLFWFSAKKDQERQLLFFAEKTVLGARNEDNKERHLLFAEDTVLGTLAAKEDQGRHSFAEDIYAVLYCVVLATTKHVITG